MKIVGLIFELLGLVLFGFGAWNGYQAGLTGDVEYLIKAAGFTISSALPMVLGNEMMK